MDSQGGSALSTGVAGAQTPSSPAGTSLSSSFPEGPGSVVMKNRHLNLRGDVFPRSPLKATLSLFFPRRKGWEHFCDLDAARWCGVVVSCYHWSQRWSLKAT